MEFNLRGIGEIIAEAKGSLEKYKENKTYNKQTYDELLEKYSSAITIIELLKSEMDRLNSSKLPTRDDVESIGAIMNLLGIEKLDSEGIAKLKNVSSEFGEKK